MFVVDVDDDFLDVADAAAVVIDFLGIIIVAIILLDKLALFKYLSFVFMIICLALFKLFDFNCFDFAVVSVETTASSSSSSPSTLLITTLLLAEEEDGGVVVEVEVVVVIRVLAVSAVSVRISLNISFNLYIIICLDSKLFVGLSAVKHSYSSNVVSPSTSTASSSSSSSSTSSCKFSRKSFCDSCLSRCFCGIWNLFILIFLAPSSSSSSSLRLCRPRNQDSFLATMTPGRHCFKAVVVMAPDPLLVDVPCVIVVVPPAAFDEFV